MPGNKVKEPQGLLMASTDSDVDVMMKNLGSERLLMLYFYLPWCSSCQRINPTMEAFAEKYQQVVFIRLNAEKCTATAKKHHVTKVPTFLLFNNRIKVDRVEGGSPTELEAKIRRNMTDIQFQKNYGISPPVATPMTQTVKMSDVTPYLDKQQCRCINDLVPTPFQEFLEGKKLVSGKGLGRMILVYAFKEKMVITSLKIKAPIYSGPKTLRFFVNLHKVLDFAVVSQMSSTQEITLTEADLGGEHSVDLRSGGLMGVQNLQIYIPENMTKNRKTEIDLLTLVGAPMSLTNFANIDSAAIATNSTSLGGSKECTDCDPVVGSSKNAQRFNS